MIVGRGCVAALDPTAASAAALLSRLRPDEDDEDDEDELCL